MKWILVRLLLSCVALVFVKADGVLQWTSDVTPENTGQAVTYDELDGISSYAFDGSEGIPYTEYTIYRNFTVLADGSFSFAATLSVNAWDDGCPLQINPAPPGCTDQTLQFTASASVYSDGSGLQWTIPFTDTISGDGLTGLVYGPVSDAVSGLLPAGNYTLEQNLTISAFPVIYDAGGHFFANFDSAVDPVAGTPEPRGYTGLLFALASAGFWFRRRRPS